MDLGVINYDTTTVYCDGTVVQGRAHPDSAKAIAEYVKGLAEALTGTADKPIRRVLMVGADQDHHVVYMIESGPFECPDHIEERDT